MKFGQIVPTNESADSILNTDKVVALNQDVQGTDQKPAEPAGLNEENIQNNPDESPAEQAADVAEIADPEQDTEVAEVTQGKEQDYETPAHMLDEIQQIGNETVKESGGTLTQFEANAIQTSVESLLGTLGMSRPAMPTLEAYAGRWSGKEAARITMESVLDSAKEIGKKIIAAMKAVLEYSINFLVGLVKNRALMEKNIERLIKKFEAVDVKEIRFRDDELHGRYVHGLAVENHASSSTARRILEDSVDLITYYGFACETLRDLRDGKGNSSVIPHLVKMVIAGQKSIGTVKLASEDPTEIYGAYAGGMSLGIVPDDRGEDSIRFISNQGTARTKDTSCPAEEPRDVLRVLNEALVLIRAIRQVEGSVNRVSDMFKGLIRQVEGEYFQLRGTLGSQEYAVKAQANKNARDAQEIMRRMIVRFPSMAFSAVKNTADWASAQFNNYQAK